MAKVKRVTNSDGAHYGYRFTCPGCKDEHVVTTAPHPNAWGFNGSVDAPTFTPSILAHEHPMMLADGTKGVQPRCHSFVTDGRIQFLGDCGHALAGQTVDLPEVA